MLKKINKSMLAASAAFVAGLSAQDAHAGGGGGNTFDNVWQNLSTSIAGIPSLITIVAYIAGVVFAVLGVLKVKEHVENPQQTPLKSGAAYLAVGGALFALPFMIEIMTNAVNGGDTSAATAQATVSALSYGGAAAG